MPSPREMDKTFQKALKNKELRCRYPIVNMKYNQFSDKYQEVFDKHIEKIEAIELEREKKVAQFKGENTQKSLAGVSTRVSNKSTNIYHKETYERFRKDVEDKYLN